MDITADNVILDCQGNIIDGNDVADYGIKIAGQNITIKRCNLTDWDTASVYVYQGGNNTLSNISCSNNTDDGIYFYQSNENNITDCISNNNLDAGFYFYDESTLNIMDNVTCNYNEQGIYIREGSNNNNFINITSLGNQQGVANLESYNINITDSNIINNTYNDVYYDMRYYYESYECGSYFTNVTGTDNLPILFYGSQDYGYSYPLVIEGGHNTSEIILCKAHNTTINNISLNHSHENNNGLFILSSNYVNITNSNFSHLYNAINLQRNAHTYIENVIINDSKSGLIFTHTSPPSTYLTMHNSQIINNTYGFLLNRDLEGSSKVIIII